MIGKDEGTDQKNGFFMPIAEQLEMACEIVTEDPKLKAGPRWCWPGAAGASSENTYRGF